MSQQSGGIGFLGLLTIVFITLKLTGHITWSWWWVLAPLWIPVSVFLGILVILSLVTGILAILNRKDLAKAINHYRSKR